ncbi:hypothetical protein PHLCEN_2v4528 [Hermanssonia centrifuga]|uniref:Uncharacterized protein n=1 Tax=Hermanssonia centrifuga TaxID=98765 RepID=A0A2R6PNE7_9APHY|nr:hypothetical protein PHLCEN_2v4528 [Hermanssonia centrifuga]
MSLRKLAQANNAATTNSRDSSAQASPSTPVKGAPRPSTPRTKLVYPHSPMTSPSLSASTPFDWDAARARKPPPYSTPTAAGKRIRALRNDLATQGTPTKQRVVRKKGLIAKYRVLSTFQIEIFPNNIPLPTPQKLAWILGGFMHFMHFLVRVSQISRIPDSELGWEDMYQDDEGSGWFDWTVPVTILLVFGSLGNAFYLFTRTRVYQLALATDPVSSPNAKFVHRERTPEPQPKRSTFMLIIRHLWHAFAISVRFLLNLSPPKNQETRGRRGGEVVQTLEVWTPGDLEMMLFSVYSPVHAWLWMALTSANWILMCLIMALVGVQFVYPRINPIRKDAAVMTHQAEMVNTWD